VFQVGPELRAESLRQRLERIRARIADFQQQDGRKVADQAVDLQVDRSALELRQVEREMPAAAPAAEDAGERGRQRD
jgi:hypothetical protein